MCFHLVLCCGSCGPARYVIVLLHGNSHCVLTLRNIPPHFTHRAITLPLVSCAGKKRNHPHANHPPHPLPQEPYTDINYHALLMQLASNPDLRPPLPTGPDWPDPPPPPEPAPGWRVLMTRCWATDPAARPTFTEVVRSLKHMSSALRRARVCGGGGGVAGPPGGGLVSAFAGNAGGVGGGVGGPVRGHGGAAAKQPAEAAANAQAAPPYAAALAGGEAASGAAAPGVVGGATTKEGEEEGQKIEGEQVLYPVTTPFEPSLGVETGAIPPSE